ncbi:MAG TPA: penicillin-binding protein 2 [Croceibacterium sp.]|jgi:cell division protein FtsI (penicillin-binding protein 3)
MNAMTFNAGFAPSRIRLVDIRRRQLLTAQLRLLLLGGGFLLVALVALLRVAWLGVVQPAPTEHSMAQALLPPRGEITDRNGVPLARAFPAYALWYNPEALGDDGPPLVKPARDVAQRLHAIFPDLDVAATARFLAAGKPGYIRRRVLPDEVNAVNAIGELALETPEESDRQYPQGKLAAHVLGYVADDGHGRVGMEAYLDKMLLDPTARGNPVPLSIDVRVQGALEDELSSGMEAVNAIGAAGIVLDVDSGEVLALASLPEFDPNRIDAQGAKDMFNRATNEVYELGSTFKPITIAAAMDAGVVTDMAKRYPATPLHVDGFTIHDDENLGPTLNVPETLIHSSNIVTAQIADQLGGARFKRVLEDLGMNERPYIELPARGFPIWHKGDWPRLRTMTVGFGHGIAVTPLHLAAAYAALVNGGIWRPATLLKVAPGDEARGRRVFTEATSAKMKQLLRMVAVYGTGRKANAPGFRVGGKTGSAEKATAGGYDKTAVVATFASAFPMDHPRYVVVVMLDDPKAVAASSFQRTAAWNAVPIVGRLIPRIGPLLGVMPDDSRDIDLSDLKPLVGDGGGKE